MHISVVIITHNEERNILRCLNSVQDVADEIVVVDSGSTDKTEEICKSFNVKFVKQSWLGYSGQKNFANSLASNDWILSIDADEELSDDLKHSILKYKNQHIPHDMVFSMNRLTNYCGHWIHHCGWYPDRKIRIWNRTVGQWKGEIHETIEFSTETREKVLKGDLNHYSYYSIEDHIRQADKFTTITATEAFKKGKRCDSIWKLRVKAAWKFIHDYFFALGFLDGYYGYVVCKISAFATFMKYSKLHEMTKGKK
ncbi:MAG: glycosyltransferase family 2 protein [Bacteroidales bacterium]|nr:glycosyltransferase family 2 protein [Bacteroidales bacterium]